MEVTLCKAGIVVDMGGFGYLVWFDKYVKRYKYGSGWGKKECDGARY